MVWAAITYATCTSLLQINGNLNADWYISDTLCLVVVPFFQDLLNAIFQQDNARSHVACHVLTLLDTQNI